MLNTTSDVMTDDLNSNKTKRVKMIPAKKRVANDLIDVTPKMRRSSPRKQTDEPQIKTNTFYNTKKDYVNPMDRATMGIKRVLVPVNGMESKNGPKGGKNVPKSTRNGIKGAKTSLNRIKKDQKASKPKKLATPMPKMTNRDVSDKIATPTTNSGDKNANLTTPTSKLATPTTNLATPTSKLATPLSKLATPTAKMTPNVSFKIATPSTNSANKNAILATPTFKLATPKTTNCGNSNKLATSTGSKTTPTSNLTNPTVELVNCTVKADLATPTKSDQPIDYWQSLQLTPPTPKQVPKRKFFSNNRKSHQTPPLNKEAPPSKLFPIFAPKFKAATPTKSPALPPPTRSSPRIKNKFRSIDKDNMQQLIIDAGQKMGLTKCSVCDMVYTYGMGEDELTHKQFHQEFLAAIKYTSWKNERSIEHHMDGKVIQILPTDPNYMLKKLDEVRAVMDRDLGFVDVDLPTNRNASYYLFVAFGKKIAGCIVAEPIKEAYRMLPSEGVLCCSTEPTSSAICGISRIWTSQMFRRKRVATRLLDAVRKHFIAGKHLAINEIAFSDPTIHGRDFAANYMKCQTFLVYNK